MQTVETNAEQAAKRRIEQNSDASGGKAGESPRSIRANLLPQSVAARLAGHSPRVHCLTNPVTMNDVANLLLAAGGSAIMAQAPEEAAAITALCDATLLNTGVPDEDKFHACLLAGRQANKLQHPIVLDPVGAGASNFRLTHLSELLREVQISLIRCNQEEARALIFNRTDRRSGGVDSELSLDSDDQRALALQLASLFQCTVLISGETDVVSDGSKCSIISGGDPLVRRITGSGCMLSALCALLLSAGIACFDAGETASRIWKHCSEEAGRRMSANGTGIGSFHMYLMDAVSLCFLSTSLAPRDLTRDFGQR